MQVTRKALRPEITTAKVAGITPAEQFQNDVLRPVLKLQNELILSIYHHFLLKRKVPFNGMSIEKRKAWIANSVSKDNRLRGILLGLVIGQFTQEELLFFMEHESDMRRRISSLLVERLQSQMKQLLQSA